MGRRSEPLPFLVHGTMLLALAFASTACGEDVSAGADLASSGGELGAGMSDLAALGDLVASVDSNGASSWSAPTSLVDDLGRLAIGNQLHIVGHLGGQLVHRLSADEGLTWGAPTVIAPASGNFPAMYGGFYATGNALFLVTADADMDSSASAGGRLIRFRRSDDNGATWTLPVDINSAGSLMYRGRVAASQNVVHFVGTSGPTAGSGASLWYFRSPDLGVTWSGSALASGLGTYGGGQTVAVDGATVHIAYTDANGSIGAGPTLYIRSTNKGASWSTPVVIGENTTGNTRQARVQLAAADGHVFACWQREPEMSGGTLPSDRLGYNTSSDDGVSWGTARLLPEDTGVERNHHHIWMATGGGAHVLWRHGDSSDTVPDPAGYKYSPDYGATWLPRVIAIDTTATLGSNHPWAAVANSTSVHLLTGPSGTMQYARKALP